MRYQPGPTAQQEAAAKAKAKAAKAKKFVYEPVLFDATQVTYLESGALVVKVQPHGCPKNGTMGMCYVGDAETGKFIGMVCENSLKPATVTAVGGTVVAVSTRSEA